MSKEKPSCAMASHRQVISVCILSAGKQTNNWDIFNAPEFSYPVLLCAESQIKENLSIAHIVANIQKENNTLLFSDQK